jgi:uncharacterized protein (TIGR02453 family)
VIGRAAFPGFARELIEFLSALERNNDKAWFDRNRKTYERLLLEPAKRLVAAMQPALAAISPGLRAEPKVGGSILRIARDVRFRKDKTPYKTTLDMMFWEGHGRNRETPGFFIRIAPSLLGIGGGLHGLTPQQLERYRRAVVDDGLGAALRRALDLMLGRWSLRARRAALQTHPARLRRQPPAWLVEALNLVRSDLEAGDAAR